jgi:hypothetical protein
MTIVTPAPGAAGILALLLSFAAATAVHPLQAQEGRSLFDGLSLAGWEITDFGSEGPVEVRDGAIVLAAGDPITGVTWTGDFPRIDYELTLEAMRVDGEDFFSAITFPVGDDPCTLVVGGWGGGLVGLSSLNGADASENVTGQWMRFEDGVWYPIRLRVTRDSIQAWIADRMVVDVAHTRYHLSIRIEVWPNQPFGIATWYTTGALRKIQVRELAGTH